ncbi:TPA: hypothetical protein IAB95_06760 [Candidatus Ventrenecus avicola]|nr:hypothetical protein [Candidatus Ventrenecus avicola]
MDFLESLYEIENFGIYLFVVIGILVVLFLIVLFFGKRDQKMRQKLEEQEESTMPKNETTEEYAFEPEQESTELNVPAPQVAESNSSPEIPEKQEESVVEDSPMPTSEIHPTSNVVLNSDLFSEATPIQPEETSATKEFDFDALAEAISKELESIDNTDKKPEPEKEEPSIEKEAPINEEKNFQVFEPIRVEKKEEPKKVEEEKKEEARPRPVMPTVFSSVYVNREKEEPKKEETVSESVKPAKPTIDLPKIADLPKRAEEPKKETSTVEDDGIIFK